MSGRRLAVIDLGSNTFRLVVFGYVPGEWWQRTDEIYERVRIGAGLAESGKLGAKRIAVALHTIEAFAHFCRATGLRPEEIRIVATSAVRDASNREDFLAAAHTVTGLDVRVLEREEEARYGYLAAVNSTSLRDGAVLDLGGGSLQLVGVRDRQAVDLASWPLGTVRMTERFLPDADATKKQLKALRSHVASELESAPWLAEAGRELAGIGGTLRNLAAAAQRRAELPSQGVQGFVLDRPALADLIDDLASRPAGDRGALRGIKPERGDVILAGAVVIDAVLEAGGFDAVQATEAGLREGIFFETYLEGRDPPRFDNVRTAGVLSLANRYGSDRAHTDHVAGLALAMFDDLAAAGLHSGDASERDLLWAAAQLHDIGTTVDYDDHHKHSRYLILSAGLPGYSPRETALIAQAARYHRKGTPGFGELEPLMGKGDGDRLNRMAALLRLAEQLERSRDQSVRSARLAGENGVVRMAIETSEDVSVAVWAAERHRDVFERAFGRELEIAVPPEAAAS